MAAKNRVSTWQVGYKSATVPTGMKLPAGTGGNQSCWDLNFGIISTEKRAAILKLDDENHRNYPYKVMEWGDFEVCKNKIQLYRSAKAAKFKADCEGVFNGFSPSHHQ